MGTMRVLHPVKGDAVLTWNPTDEMSVKEVRTAFDELVGNGMTGIIGKPGEEVATRTFDPQAEEITVISALQGG